MKPQSPDTDLAIEKLQIERLRSMTSQERMEHVGALGRMVDELAMARLRERYPDASEADNRLRLASRWLDDETMMRVYGWDPEERGR